MVESYSAIYSSEKHGKESSGEGMEKRKKCEKNVKIIYIMYNVCIVYQRVNIKNPIPRHLNLKEKN